MSTTPTTDPKASSSTHQSRERIFASPLAKRLAKDAGIDLVNIKGSGPHGRIVKADVEQAKETPPAPVATASQSNAAVYDDPDIKTNIFGMAYKEIPNNNIRKIVAKRLTESKQDVPHFYLTVDCTLDILLASRKELNEKANGEYKISVNDFIIKAVAMALKAYPAANVSWTDEAVHQYMKADISVAVSTPSGLITPIVKAAEDKGLKDISNEIKYLAERARDNKLTPEEFQGGSFTVSNLGMFGVKNFVPIINTPQGCILAIGAGEQRPIVDNGEIKIKTVMSCTLSVDHRCVDGAVGAEFLRIFKRYIENPVSMLI
ncbi:MAG: 2-oxo acid dehydrogenase subunit E2 [Alphaproteobacteria bacterium]|nr:2-oxo acid dehydrogenase subunit E2 [Alphaproteobacteria bacterium]